MLVALMFAPEAAVGRAVDGQDHHHDAPHGGTLIELGDHFAHLELMFDAGTGTVTAWILDGGAEAPIRLTQPTLAIIIDAPPALANRPLELQARASVLTGERVGDSSEFVFTHQGLRGLERITGRVIEVTVRGATFRDLRFDVPAGAHP